MALAAALPVSLRPDSEQEEPWAAPLPELALALRAQELERLRLALPRWAAPQRVPRDGWEQG